MRYFTGFFILLLIPMVALTQELNPFKTNSKYVNVEIDETPFISGGYFLQDDLSLELGMGVAFRGDVDSNGLGLRFGIDKYLSTQRLASFVGGFTKFEINPNSLGQTFWEGSRLSLGGHWGLNYFILDNLSIAGALGAELQLNSPENLESSTNFITFTSGLKVRFFF